jgi:hypothetical protein
MPAVQCPLTACGVPLLLPQVPFIAPELEAPGSMTEMMRALGVQWQVSPGLMLSVLSSWAARPPPFTMALNVMASIYQYLHTTLDSDEAAAQDIIYVFNTQALVWLPHKVSTWGHAPH